MRNDLADNVPTQAGIDEADHQHLVTYTIAFGITGTLDPTGRRSAERSVSAGQMPINGDLRKSG